VIVAIDGPAGAGKSTVARLVADALGYEYLDTGAMYRCAGLRGTPDVAVTFEHGRVILDGVDVSEEIRTPEAAQAASRAAADPAVRAAMTEQQRVLLQSGDWVAEGRDIGTVVAPHADIKIWLDADPSERAARREIPLDDLLERDARDAGREHAPMVAAPDAIHVDTTDRSIDEVVDEIVGIVQRPEADGPGRDAGQDAPRRYS
jgi:cytidylate kinase